MTSAFFIADTSPIFSYSPCVDCGNPASWASAYSPRGDGYDVTFHEATNSSSKVSFTTTASKVEFRTGGSDGGACDATYSIDNGTFSDGCSVTLSGNRHTIQIQPASGVGSFRFYGVAGTSAIQHGSLRNLTVDDTSSSFAYTGAWTYMASSGAQGQVSNATVAEQFTSNMSRLYNGTGSITTAKDASYTLTFKGNAVYLYGVSGPEGGLAQVALDGDAVQTINMTNLWESYSSLFFFETGLDAAVEHELTVTNLSPGSQLVLDYALVSTQQTSKQSSPNLVMIIGIIAGVSAALLISGVLLYLYLTERRKRPSQSPMPYHFANGISYRDINLNTGKSSSIDSWRKNAYPATPSSTDDSPASGQLLSHPQLGAGTVSRQTSSPGQSPPPEYPDYIPYRGPVEREPPPPADPADPADPEETRSSGTPASPPPSSQNASPQGGVYRPAAIPLRSRRQGDMDDVHLDGHPQQELISPSSTMTSMLSATMATRAMGATRTVARLWPVSGASHGGTDSDGSTAHVSEPPFATLPYQTSPSGTPRRPARPERALSSDILTYAAAYIYASPTTPGGTSQASLGLRDAGQSPSSTHPNTGTFNSLSTSITSPYPPSSYDFAGAEGPATIRRGVSIKSVKTMRSFFSSLLNPSNSGQGRSETPAVPSASGYENARPDSGIFPSSVLAGSSSRHEGAAITIQRVPSFTAKYGGGALGLGLGSRASRGSRGRGRWPSASASSTGAPPMLRLDSTNGVGQNFIIELDPNSPITAFGGSRPGSVLGSSWRSHV